MFSSFLLAILISTLVKSVDPVKGCYFCVDYQSACKKNDEDIRPNKMACDRFLVNRMDSPRDYFKEPKGFTKRNWNYVFAAALGMDNIKTRCIDVLYKFKKDTGVYEEIQNDTDKKRTITYHEPRNFTFKSCMYRQFKRHQNACEFFRKDVLTEHFQVFECKICKGSYCNLATMKLLNKLTAVVTVLAVMMSTSY